MATSCSIEDCSYRPIELLFKWEELSFEDLVLRYPNKVYKGEPLAGPCYRVLPGGDRKEVEASPTDELLRGFDPFKAIKEVPYLERIIKEYPVIRELLVGAIPTVRDRLMKRWGFRMTKGNLSAVRRAVMVFKVKYEGVCDRYYRFVKWLGKQDRDKKVLFVNDFYSRIAYFMFKSKKEDLPVGAQVLLAYLSEEGVSVAQVAQRISDAFKNRAKHEGLEIEKQKAVEIIEALYGQG